MYQQEDHKGRGERRASTADYGQERARRKERPHSEAVEGRRNPERSRDGGPGEHRTRLSDSPDGSPEILTYPEDGGSKDDQQGLGSHRRQDQRKHPANARGGPPSTAYPVY